MSTPKLPTANEHRRKIAEKDQKALTKAVEAIAAAVAAATTAEVEIPIAAFGDTPSMRDYLLTQLRTVYGWKFETVPPDVIVEEATAIKLK